MSIFSSILDKLGIHKPAAPVAPAAPATPAAPVTPAMPAESANPYTPGHMGTYVVPPAATAVQPSSGYPTPGPSIPAPAPAPKPAEMPMVDVVTHLDYLAKTGPIQGLNWRMSINDLMALLGLDHSPQAIKTWPWSLAAPRKR